MHCAAPRLTLWPTSGSFNKDPANVITHIMHDSVQDDLETVSALAAMLFDAAWRTTHHNQKPTEKEQEESQ